MRVRDHIFSDINLHGNDFVRKSTRDDRITALFISSVGATLLYAGLCCTAYVWSIPLVVIGSAALIMCIAVAILAPTIAKDNLAAAKEEAKADLEKGPIDYATFKKKKGAIQLVLEDYPNLPFRYQMTGGQYIEWVLESLSSFRRTLKRDSNFEIFGHEPNIMGIDLTDEPQEFTIGNRYPVLATKEKIILQDRAAQN